MGNDEAQHVAKCAVCGKSSLSALVGVGFFCSKPCRKILMARDEEEMKKLLEEHIAEIPEKLDVPAFERYALKAAVHMLHTLPPMEKIRWRRDMPLLLIPRELSLAIKEKAIPHIPLDYVSALEAQGHERFLHGGTYQFKKPVPKEIILKAFIDGGVFKKNPEEGDR